MTSHNVWTEIVPSVLSAMSVALLALIGKGFLTLTRDFRRFMTEHLWLLATTLWTRDKVMQVMARLDMPADPPPPDDLPWTSSRK